MHHRAPLTLGIVRVKCLDEGIAWKFGADPTMFDAVLRGISVGLTLTPEGMPLMDSTTSAALIQYAYEVATSYIAMYAVWSENCVIDFPHFEH